jgi:hypothetical protein
MTLHVAGDMARVHATSPVAKVRMGNFCTAS